MNVGQVKRALKKFILDKNYRFVILSSFGFYRSMDDIEFCKKSYYAHTGRVLNLDNPQSFNEKLQWLKLYYKNPLYTKMVDKYEVRKIVEERVGSEYLTPLLGVWDKPEQINFDLLPQKFVLKCTHNSGLGMCICKDKAKLNIHKVTKSLTKGLKENHFYREREWPYKNAKPRIIAEKFLENTEFGGLIDYKFYCFNGIPRFLYIGFADIVDDIKHDKMSFLTLDWEKAPFYRTDHEPLSTIPEKPCCFDEMISIAKKLSEGIPFVRVDLFMVDNKVFFSEFTFTPGGGLGIFSPYEWEMEIGSWIDLEEVKLKNGHECNNK